MELQRDWHALEAEAALAALEAEHTGLSLEEAAARLARFGPNRLSEARGRSPFKRFLAQFDNLLIYVLIAAGLITLGLGHWVDSAVIFGVVVINALIGFLQEGRAEEALASIRGLLSLHSVVLRDGRRLTVPAEELVPGDIVLLRSGDKVPADLRLLATHSFATQEAAITGEALPVDKQATPVEAAAMLGDRHSLAFAGTLVAQGQATGLVVATGRATELGRISELVASVPPLTTPLLRQMAAFSKTLTVAILGLTVVGMLFGIFVHGESLEEMFLAGVGLAVAAIPEGLPAILTITLAVGVTRMAGRNAIIRRLPAVETLGAVSVICSDKTGTLTRNELSVQEVVTALADYRVSGTGYGGEGTVTRDGQAVVLEAHPDLAAAALAALHCNDADMEAGEDGEWRLAGSPTDGALLALAMKLGYDLRRQRAARPRSDLTPFESERKFMASLHHDPAGHGHIYVKGAPERLLAMCRYQQAAGAPVPLDPAYWQRRIDELAGAGQRVLAIASRAVASEHRKLSTGDLDGELVLIALFGIIDPPRAEAVQAIAECRSAGIAVKMITGDHALTARAIAERLGLGDGGEVLTGRDLDRLDDQALIAAAREAEVFARTTPEHKLRLVQALQAAGAVVAMTGDGVNDAPALKRADVGVAMGRKGTEAAKEAAEMVLADDNFASIAHAVEEGRTVYDNLKKAILFILPTSGGEALTILASIVIGVVLPITPVQILWVNMVTAITLSLALAFEQAEPEIMARRPRRMDEPLLSGFVIWRLAFVSLLLVAATFGLFVWLRAGGASVEAARTAAVNLLVVGEIVYLFNTRRGMAPACTRAGLFGSRIALWAVAAVGLLQLLFTYLPPMQTVFGAASLDARQWALILAAGLGLFLLVELEKTVLRFWQRRQG